MKPIIQGPIDDLERRVSALESSLSALRRSSSAATTTVSGTVDARITDLSGSIDGGFASVSGTVNAALVNLSGTIDAAIGALGGGAFFDTVLGPFSVGSHQNNYAPGTLGANTLIMFEATAGFNLTGLAGGSDGKVVTILNINTGGPNVCTVSHSSSNSTHGNRFRNRSGLNTSGEGVYGAVSYYYHGVAAMWLNISST